MDVAKYSITFYILVSTIVLCFLLIKYSFSEADNTKKKKQSIDNSKEVERQKEIIKCTTLLRQHIPETYPTYKPNMEIFKKFQLNYKDEAVLKELAIDILKHCNCSLSRLTVKVEKLVNVAGKLNVGDKEIIITINDDVQTNEEEIFAILIHECMHCVLLCKKIVVEERYINELLADVAAVYMGFYEYFRAGYWRVGYISREDLDFVDLFFAKDCIV